MQTRCRAQLVNGLRWLTEPLFAVDHVAALTPALAWDLIAPVVPPLAPRPLM